MTFEENYAATVAELALFHAGKPGEDVAASLEATRANIVAGLTEMFTNTDVDLVAMVDKFIRAIVERRAEIERNAMGARMLN
jgi:hypothetical protein